MSKKKEIKMFEESLKNPKRGASKGDIEKGKAILKRNKAEEEASRKKTKESAVKSAKETVKAEMKEYRASSIKNTKRLD